MTNQELENLREQRGTEIVSKKGNQVNRIDDYLYTVKSQSGTVTIRFVRLTMN